MTPKIAEENHPSESDDIAFDSQYLSPVQEEMDELLDKNQEKCVQMKIVWRNVIIFTFLHIGSLIGLYQMFFLSKWATILWAISGWVISGFGITAGAHRLWSHRSFKARLPMRIVLMLANCMAFENDIIEWSRDHRCHHKWTDTNADPHNVSRGLFFAHIGWLMVTKHPEIAKRGKKLDMSDLFADPVLRFQRRFYLPLVIFFCFILPTLIPVYFWDEQLMVAFYIAGLFRYCFTLHMTWCINSASHYWGYRPYNPNISPVESLLTCIGGLGEGGHNYHHTFPQDYRTSEYTFGLNLTKCLIDIFAFFGMAYDLKTTSDKTIARQKAKYQ